MTAREEWVLGVSVLQTFLSDHLLLGRLMAERSYAELYAAARLIHDDVDPRLALTDPHLYKTLRDAITLAHIKGYGGLDLHAIKRLRDAHT